MGARKKKEPVAYDPPIKPLKIDGRSKISYYHYATYEDAVAVRPWVKARAAKRIADGYDSGYLSPGAIDKCEGPNGIEFRICVL